MTLSRQWLISDQSRWIQVLRALQTLQLDFQRRPIEIIVREARREKSADQRKLWHAVMGELAPHLGLTPGETKQLIKSEFYGVETKIVFGKPHEFVQSSEESDRAEYSRLIDFTYQFSAEQGIYLQERR